MTDSSIPPVSINDPFAPPKDRPRQGTGLKLVTGLVLAAIIFALGWTAAGGSIGQVNGNLTVDRAYDSSRADYSLFWETYDLLNSKFVDRPLDQQALLYGAIAGMVAASGDPYTSFFDPEQAAQFAADLEGMFDGIGAEIGIRDGQIVVIAPLDNSPAERAGLMPGDAILAIDGEPTLGLTPEQAASSIRGEAGTEVKLTVLHPDQGEAVDVTIERDQIVVNSLKYETREVNGMPVAVIELSRFGDDTMGLFNHAADVLLETGAKGIVLDLRSNPGGYLDTAIDIASNWVDTDELVLQEKLFNGEVTEYRSEIWPRLKGIPTAVLVNGGSASASEIVAGALQDHGLATVVGEQTYGKGSVQELEDLRDGSTVKITIAKWLTPDGRSIDGNGLEPDVVIEMTNEDYDAGRDPQMDRALQILTQ